MTNFATATVALNGSSKNHRHALNNRPSLPYYLRLRVNFFQTSVRWNIRK